jgi:hypothetical protein
MAPEMEETMDRLIKIEKLAEQLSVLQAQNLELNEKKEANRECLGAFRRGEIQTNNKLWVTIGTLQVKLPRKNAVDLIESEQVKLTKLIDDAREEIKQTSRDLLALQPNLTDMDPFTVKLLLEEQRSSKKRATGSAIDEESDESD